MESRKQPEPFYKILSPPSYPTPVRAAQSKKIPGVGTLAHDDQGVSLDVLREIAGAEASATASRIIRGLRSSYAAGRTPKEAYEHVLSL